MSRRKDLDLLPRLDGAAIRRARGVRSQEWLAREVGVSLGAVSRWERGTIRQVSPERMTQLAAALGVRPSRITLRQSAPAPPASTPHTFARAPR